MTLAFKKCVEEMSILLEKQEDNYINDLEWYGSLQDLESHNRQKRNDILLKYYKQLNSYERTYIFDMYC